MKEATKELQDEYDRTSLKLGTKKHVDKIIAITIISFLGIVIGSWLGLGFIDMISGIDK